MAGAQSMVGFHFRKAAEQYTASGSFLNSIGNVSFANEVKVLSIFEFHFTTQICEFHFTSRRLSTIAVDCHSVKSRQGCWELELFAFHFRKAAEQYTASGSFLNSIGNVSFANEVKVL